MNEKVEHIKFNNQTLPKAQFDLVRLEELFKRKTLDHNPEERHKVDFFIIIIITEGQGIHTIDFTDYPYQKGSILTIRQDQIHKFNIGKAKGFLLLFTDDFLVSYLEKLEALKSLQLFNEFLGVPKVQLDNQEFIEMIALVNDIEKEYFKRRDDYAMGIIRSLLHIFIAKLYRSKSKKKLIIQNRKYLSEFLSFQQLVEKDCFETRKVSDYARKLGFSTKTLNNVVQSIVDKPAKTFIDEIVITQIKRLLINSTLTIKEIAYTAGFDEPTNLYKYFKRYTHFSPEAFRQAQK